MTLAELEMPNEWDDVTAYMTTAEATGKIFNFSNQNTVILRNAVDQLLIGENPKLV